LSERHGNEEAPMDEHDFDALREWRSFKSSDVRRVERLGMFALGLWGRTLEDLHRQLAADHPALPPGCDLADLRRLFGQAQSVLAVYTKETMDHNTRIFVDRFLRPHDVIVVGTQRFTPWEARCEVARRAIVWLEGRGGSSHAKTERTKST
jgi:hypothetical protein